MAQLLNVFPVSSWVYEEASSDFYNRRLFWIGCLPVITLNNDPESSIDYKVKKFRSPAAARVSSISIDVLSGYKHDCDAFLQARKHVVKSAIAAFDGFKAKRRYCQVMCYTNPDRGIKGADFDLLTFVASQLGNFRWVVFFVNSEPKDSTRPTGETIFEIVGQVVEPLAEIIGREADVIFPNDNAGLICFETR